MRLPAALLVHTVTVEPYLGSSGRGPRYGPPVTVRCLVEEKRRTVRSKEGRTVVAGSTIRAQLDAPIRGPEDRVTYRGTVVEVLAVARHDGGRSTPNHVEVMVQ